MKTCKLVMGDWGVWSNSPTNPVGIGGEGGGRRSMGGGGGGDGVCSVPGRLTPFHHF